MSSQQTEGAKIAKGRVDKVELAKLVEESLKVGRNKIYEMGEVEGDGEEVLGRMKRRLDRRDLQLEERGRVGITRWGTRCKERKKGTEKERASDSVGGATCWATDGMQEILVFFCLPF